MLNMKELILIFFLSISISSRCQESKVYLVEELISITNLENDVSQILDSFIKEYKNVYENIPSSYWNDIRESFNKKKLINDTKKVYQKSFTEEELKELINFYKLNKKQEFERKKSKINNELYSIGKSFGENISIFIQSKIKNYTR